MNTSRLGQSRTRSLFLAAVFTAPLLAAGCSTVPYPPPGKTFQAAQASQSQAPAQAQGQAQGQAGAAPQTASKNAPVAATPLPWRTVASAQAEAAEAPALAMAQDATQKPQPEAMAPAAPLAQQAPAPKASAQQAAVQPAAPAKPAASQAAAADPTTLTPPAPAVTAPKTAKAVMPEDLEQRAADLFLDSTEETPAPPKSQTAAPASAQPAAEALQPAPKQAMASEPAPTMSPAAPETAPRTTPQAAPAQASTETAEPAAPLAAASELQETNVAEARIRLPNDEHATADQQMVTRETQEALATAAATSPAAGSKASASSARILFEEASAVLSTEAQAELANLANQLAKSGQAQITILGYGDGEGLTGDAGQARVLALSRVMAVRQYLMVRGLPPERLVARALGNQMSSGPASRVDVMIGQL